MPPFFILRSAAGGRLARCPPAPPDAPLVPVEYGDSQPKQSMTRFEVYVPSAPYESESTHDEGRAWDICLSLSEEFGYAQVRQNGMILGDYTNGQ